MKLTVHSLCPVEPEEGDCLYVPQNDTTFVYQSGQWVQLAVCADPTMHWIDTTPDMLGGEDELTLDAFRLA